VAAGRRDHPDDLLEPAQGEGGHLQRHQRGARGAERRDGVEAEVRRGVEEDDVVVGVEALAQRIAQPQLGVHPGGELGLDGAEIGVGRDQVEARGLGLEDGVDGGASAHDDVGDGAAAGVGVEAQARGEVALRVAVDEQDAPPQGREARAQVDHRGGLADTALACDDGNPPSLSSHPSILSGRVGAPLWSLSPVVSENARPEGNLVPVRPPGAIVRGPDRPWRPRLRRPRREPPGNRRVTAPSRSVAVP